MDNEARFNRLMGAMDLVEDLMANTDRDATINSSQAGCLMQILFQEAREVMTPVFRYDPRGANDDNED